MTDMLLRMMRMYPGIQRSIMTCGFNIWYGFFNDHNNNMHSFFKHCLIFAFYVQVST